MLKLKNIGRYTELALLMRRYGLKDFKIGNKSEIVLAEPPADDEQPLQPDVQSRAKAFAESLKKMGPTFVKFGQIVSTRPDIVPNEYVVELESLQDDVEPFSFADVEKIIESELKVRISKAFQSFEATPLAAASLGQVHEAVLRDGREVVVKVQRPDIRETIDKDLEVFLEIAETLETRTEIGRKMNVAEMVRQFSKTLLNELNYVQEANNMETFRRNLKEFPQIRIPEVVKDFSAAKVLTTERIRGKKVSKLTPFDLMEHNHHELATVLTRAYLKQICVDGFWHSDPHPGNIFIEGEQLILLDFGMVARISGEFQDNIIKFLLGVTENRGAEVAELMIHMGHVEEGFDRERFIHDISTMVSDYHDADFTQVNTGQLIFNVIGIANSHALQVPSELAMLAKTLLHLDGITKKLDPDYNPQQVIREYAESLISKKVAQKFHPRNFYTALLDLNQLALDLPRRTRDIVDQAAGGKLTLNIKLQQADDFLKGMHKIANRITVGLVIAALVVGSSLMMRVPSRFQILGYPAIAMAGYLAASITAFYLIISTLMQDTRDREKAKKK